MLRHVLKSPLATISSVRYWVVKTAHHRPGISKVESNQVLQTRLVLFVCLLREFSVLPLVALLLLVQF